MRPALCAGSTNTGGEATRRVLRSLIKTDKETVEERELVPKNLKMMTREETQLMEMAHRLGYALTPVIKLRRELAQAIASRMINRTGENVYQSAAFSITNFPLSVLQELLPALLLTKDSNGTKTWSLTSAAVVASYLGPLMQEMIGMCGGASRALKTASERWSRVLATIYDLEISFTWTAKVNQTHINFLYVLTDENGEMHKPKDANRVELLLAPGVETSIRQQVLSDAIVMNGLGYSLAAGWLTSMGETAKAAWVKTLQKNTLASASALPALLPGEKKARKKRKHEEYFEVEKILEERTTGRLTEYLVRWAGYEQEWEAMRMEGHGQPGDPIDTWEPWLSVKDTEALEAWEAR